MRQIVVAANRGDVGGGEVMLVNLAVALRELGHDVSVVAPAQPDGVLRLAEAQSLPVTAIPGRGRAAYARELRRWHEHHRGVLLWCNGLLPAAATSLRGGRVVHLHQMPDGPVRRIMWILARRRAVVVVVPSEHMREQLGPSVRVLPNWTQGELSPREPVAPRAGDRIRIGYLGRVGRAKGVDVLGQACALLPGPLRDRIELVVAGDDRFMPRSDRAVVEAALMASGVAVRRPGWQSRRDFYTATDLAVFPSVWAEPFGLVVAEAMESRTPVVVSDAGALPEVVGADYAWTARHGDAVDLAAIIARAVGALPAAEQTAELRDRWHREFSPAAGCRNLAALLDSLGGRGGLM